jgi:Polyketide cyclase / dehydrase and lipid transport
VTQQIFEQSIQIQAPALAVERTLTEQQLMHRWLHPLLRCDPIGEWNTSLGGQFRFFLRLPLLQPALKAVVIEQQPGLLVWGFEGFFTGRDRWQWHQEGSSTCLVNQFEFEIPNALVAFGFNTFAAGLTRQDMQAQLQRLKKVAENL